MTILSVIIPTRNRADSLQLTLQSLLSQSLPSDAFEVLVIDNGSTDNTGQVVSSFQKQLGSLRHFFASSPGLHVGRHLGMKMAKSNILVYADDDIEAFPTWLAAIAESFLNPEVALVGGKNLPKYEEEPPEWIMKMWEADRRGNRICGYLSILDLGEEIKEITPYKVFGCNFSIRKSVLHAAKGFHPDSVPQELIRYRGDGETYVSRFIERRKMKTLYNPAASVFHAVPKERLTLDYFRKRAFNEGISKSFAQFRSENSIETCSQSKDTLPDPMELLRALRRKIEMAFLRDRELAKIHRELRQAMLQGWSYHRKALEDDPDLRSYVLRDHFID